MVESLLAPLAFVEPVQRRMRRLRRSSALALVVATVVVAAGAAFAGELGPLVGIGAANRPSHSSDRLDATVTGQIRRFNAFRARMNAAPLVTSEARLLGEAAEGFRVYVIPTHDDSLCVLVEQRSDGATSGIACGDPLSAVQPTTIATIQKTEQTPPLTFGIAKDGVTAVSFQASGAEQTIRVKNNVWYWLGTAALEKLTVHYGDGHTQVLIDGRG